MKQLLIYFLVSVAINTGLIGCSNTPGYTTQDVSLSGISTRPSAAVEVTLKENGWPIILRVNGDQMKFEDKLNLRSKAGTSVRVSDQYTINDSAWSGTTSIAHDIEATHYTADLMLLPIQNDKMTLQFGGGLRKQETTMDIYTSDQRELIAIESINADATFGVKYHYTPKFAWVFNSSASVSLESESETFDLDAGLEYLAMPWLRLGLSLYYHRSYYDNDVFEKIHYSAISDKCFANPDATETSYGLFSFGEERKICLGGDSSGETDMKFSPISGLKTTITFIF